MTGAVLSREDILKLLELKPPLVEGLVDLEEQLQPNGIDLTLRSVAIPSSLGQVGLAAEDRRIAENSPLQFDGLGYLELIPGSYLITYNEVVHLPKNVMAFGHPRSSLLRCGVTIHMAVWDAGYSGRSQSLMVVYNPYGFRIARNARVMQLVFFFLASEPQQGYQGIFQGEG